MIFERIPIIVFERFPKHIIFEVHFPGAIRAYSNEKLRQSWNVYVASICHLPPPSPHLIPSKCPPQPSWISIII